MISFKTAVGVLERIINYNGVSGMVLSYNDQFVIKASGDIKR